MTLKDRCFSHKMVWASGDGMEISGDPVLYPLSFSMLNRPVGSLYYNMEAGASEHLCKSQAEEVQGNG